MRIGIMQPYFMPYPGYFALIKHTDQWVVFDTANYIKNGWINRNKILAQTKEGISYITIPLHNKSRNISIKDTYIDETQEWRLKMMRQVEYYKNKAPYFNEVYALLSDILACKTDNISELNIYSLKKTCEYLKISFHYTVFSDDRMGIETVNAPDEWALEISKKMGADIYINPPGGKSFYNSEKYRKDGVELLFLSLKPYRYKTFEEKFTPDLSIIDAMMFNSVDEIASILNNRELTS
ncbi:MAG: WbqC family protein [Draconibacterium sp.]